MKWLDITDIAIELADKYPDEDPYAISFPELQQRVINLNGFVDDKNKCNERILEAIVQAWQDEIA
jgi:FeS assembly protein IscX